MQATARISRFIVFSQSAAIVVMLVGIIVLIGWMLNISALKTVLPNLVSMKANTAVCFCAAGAALFLLDARSSARLQRIGRIVAAGVVAVGSLTLLEYIFAVDFGIDQLLFLDDAQATATSNPGRMAPITAICMILSGASLLSMDCYVRLAQRMILFVLILAALALTGYSFGAQSLYQIRAYTSIALHTAVTLIILSFGIIAARPANGFMKLISSHTSAGLMSRRLLVIVPIVLIILAGVTFQGKTQNLYDDRFAMALVLVFSIITTCYLVLIVARTIYRLDMIRLQAEAELVALNNNLENTVAERTKSLEKVNRTLSAEITERRQAEEEVRRLSVTDELTGLMNRRGFLFLAEQNLILARRTKTISALIYIDLDGLKTVNDKFGHSAGDAMIKDAAQVMKASFRDGDIIARLGGDEFAIWAVDGAKIDIALQRMNAVLAQFYAGQDSPHQLKFSAGVLLCQPDGQKSLLELLVEADGLMYKQKQEHHLQH